MKFHFPTGMQACCLAVVLQAGFFPETDATGLVRSALAAQAQGSAARRAEVEALIRQLGSAQRTTRVAAEKKLQTFGPDILELLPPPDLIRSLATRQAVRRIRIRLEDQAASQSLKPVPVTVTGPFPVDRLASELEKQTGNSIRIPAGTGSGKRPQNLIVADWKSVTFWEALRTLEPSGWFARFDASSGGLQLSRVVKFKDAVVSTQGAFRIRAGVLQSKTVDDDSALLQTRITFECEPRLRPLFLNYASDDFSLKSGSLLVSSFDEGARIELPLGVSGREAVIHPRFLVTGQTDTADIQGQVSLLLAAAESPVKFTELGRSQGVARRRGGVTVVVSSIRTSRNQGRYTAQVRVRISYDRGTSAFESHQTWVFHNRAWLSSDGPDGRMISPKSFETLLQNETGVGVEYVFSDLTSEPDEMSFVYLAPTQLVRVPLKLNLSDVPVMKARHP